MILGEEIIFRYGVPELSLYDDRTHSYLTPGRTGSKILFSTVKDLICLLYIYPPGSTWMSLHSLPDWCGEVNKFGEERHKMEEADKSVRGGIGVSAQALTH